MSSSSTFQRTSFVRRALLSMLGLLALTVLVMTALVIRHDHPLDIPSDQSRWDALALPDAQPPAGLSFTTFLTAQSAGAPEGLIVAGGSWFTPRRPVQFAVLIRHPKGNLLFDTGLGLRHAEHFAENTWWHQQLFAYTMHTPVKTQLTQQGMADLPLRWIVPSHMHWDHIGGLQDFPATPVWTPLRERQTAAQGRPPAFLATQFQGVQHWLNLEFTHPPVLGFDQSHDVYGDGSVILLPLPGHTAGQVGMLLTLPSGQRYLFTADTTWTLEGIQRPADRSWLLRQVLRLDHSEPQNQQAIVHLHQIARRFPALKVVPAHDERVYETLPRFPQFAD